MSSEFPPWFPAWCIEFSEPVDDPKQVAQVLHEHRPDSRWLLLGYPTVISERHLWSAWLAVGQREKAEDMVSREIDGEFLRLISGTHQMKLAFSRAGISKGDGKAWLVRLPEFTDDDVELPANGSEYDADADSLMGWLGAELSAERPHPSAAALHRLGVDESEMPEPSEWEATCLARIALADIGG